MKRHLQERHFERRHFERRRHRPRLLFPFCLRVTREGRCLVLWAVFIVLICGVAANAAPKIKSLSQVDCQIAAEEKRVTPDIVKVCCPLYEGINGAYSMRPYCVAAKNANPGPLMGPFPPVDRFVPAEVPPLPGKDAGDCLVYHEAFYSCFRYNRRCLEAAHEMRRFARANQSAARRCGEASVSED